MWPEISGVSFCCCESEKKINTMNIQSFIQSHVFSSCSAILSHNAFCSFSWTVTQSLVTGQLIN